MPHVLTAMEISKELGLFALHRLTVVMLADVSIDMAESLYAQELVNEVYGKVSISSSSQSSSGENAEVNCSSDLTAMIASSRFWSARMKSSRDTLR
jgi:hypothetical protein